MSSRRILAGLAVTAALVVPAGGPLAAAPPSPAAASTAPASRSLDLPPGTLVASGPAADLEVLFTGDVIGYIEPCG